MQPKEAKPYAPKKEMMAVRDTMDVLLGKWKIAIISSLCFSNKILS
ncbi:hypothetical protein [Flagellimonas oceani]|nr:hypothetical protein [Allomuricauda oceani]